LLTAPSPKQTKKISPPLSSLSHIHIQSSSLIDMSSAIPEQFTGYAAMNQEKGKKLEVEPWKCRSAFQSPILRTLFPD